MVGPRTYTLAHYTDTYTRTHLHFKRSLPHSTHIRQTEVCHTSSGWNGDRHDKHTLRIDNLSIAPPTVFQVRNSVPMYALTVKDGRTSTDSSVDQCGKRHGWALLVLCRQDTYTTDGKTQNNMA